jgi:hypothetical protein
MQIKGCRAIFSRKGTKSRKPRRHPGMKRKTRVGCGRRTSPNPPPSSKSFYRTVPYIQRIAMEAVAFVVLTGAQLLWWHVRGERRDKEGKGVTLRRGLFTSDCFTSPPSLPIIILSALTMPQLSSRYTPSTPSSLPSSA